MKQRSLKDYKDFLNEVSFYNLYQNELLDKTNYGGRYYDLGEGARMERIEGEGRRGKRRRGERRRGQRRKEERGGER
jgi:hypothetical protein